MSFFHKIILNIKTLRAVLGDKKDELERIKVSSERQIKGSYRIYGDSSADTAEIGKYSYVALNSVIRNCKIGKFCSIGPHVVIGYGNHPTRFISTSPAFYLKDNIAGVTFTDKDLFESSKEVIIENDVWIGANVYIKNGVVVGNGAIIGAGAVVVDNVPDYAIVGGIPAKIIKYRFENNIIQSLLKIKWWDWDEKKLKQTHHFFVSEDVESFINWVNTVVK